MSRPKKIITRDKALRIRLTQEEYEEKLMDNGITMLRLSNKNEKIPLYFSNGKKLVEILVAPEEAITIADSISQISEMAAEEGESYSTMAILLGITDKKSLIKHMEVNDED